MSIWAADPNRVTQAIHSVGVDRKIVSKGKLITVRAATFSGSWIHGQSLTLVGNRSDCDGWDPLTVRRIPAPATYTGQAIIAFNEPLDARDSRDVERTTNQRPSVQKD